MNKSTAPRQLRLEQVAKAARARRQEEILGKMIAWVILGAIGGVLVMFAFAILASAFPAIPAISYLHSVGVCFVVWVIKLLFR